MVGTDVNSGVARFDFGVPELQDGIDFAIVAMGVFGFAEIMTNLEQKENRVDITDKIGSLYPNKQEFKEAAPAVLVAPRWARRWASCRAAAPCVVVRVVHAGKEDLAQSGTLRQAIRPAWPARNRPTTPPRRPRSSRC